MPLAAASGAIAQLAQQGEEVQALRDERSQLESEFRSVTLRQDNAIEGLRQLLGDMFSAISELTRKMAEQELCLNAANGWNKEKDGQIAALRLELKHNAETRGMTDLMDNWQALKRAWAPSRTLPCSLPGSNCLVGNAPASEGEAPNT